MTEFGSHLQEAHSKVIFLTFSLIHQNSPLAWAILMYIHKQQDESPLQRPSTNLHRQKNTLYLESLRYGVILHAKRILKTIEEDSCMKFLRRKKSFLKQSLGQPSQANFQKVIRPFQYMQMDLTGRHIAAGGEEIYGLVCICLQTYNTRIYGIQNRKIESVSLALEVLIQEVGPPDFISCDREGAFQQLAKELHPKEIGALEATHQVQFKFAVPNAHFTTGLVERRMRIVHDFIGKMKMQGAGMSVADLSLMFQYVASQINVVPYGVRCQKYRFVLRYENSESQTRTRTHNFHKTSRLGLAVKDTIDKLNVLDKLRTNEMMNIINKQYDNVCLEASNKLKFKLGCTSEEYFK